MEQSHKENGVSVVSIIVGIAVVGVLIALASTMFSQNLSSLKLQQEASTAEELKEYLKVGMGCPPVTSAWVLKSEIAVLKQDGISPFIKVKSAAGYEKIVEVDQCLRAIVTVLTPKKTFDVEYSPDCVKWKSLKVPKECP